MNVFDHIDRDKIIGFLAYSWWIPLRDWPLGIADEIFYLHDLFRHHRRYGRDWDMGLRQPAVMSHQIAQLHQRGPNHSDRFGSDFAITIDIRGAVNLRKTALFSN